VDNDGTKYTTKRFFVRCGANHQKYVCLELVHISQETECLNIGLKSARDFQVTRRSWTQVTDKYNLLSYQ